MRVVNTEVLPNGIGFSVIEVTDLIVRKNFDKRFQIALEINNKRFFPMLKKRYLKFTNKNYIYSLNSEKTGQEIRLNEFSYRMKQICDKSLEECNTELMQYISMYNQGQDIKKVLKKTYSF
jgi:hypothetical protein